MAPPTPKARSSETSKLAILEAATTEFVEKGFHGARIEHIAKRAGVNKALVYRYYGDRDNLITEVLRAQLARREAILARIPDRLADSLEVWYRETARSGSDFLKLLQREALDTDRAVIEGQRRSAYYEAQIDILRQWQQRGRVSADFDVRYLFLALMALVAFPIGFPQLTHLVSGRQPDDEGFVRSWTKLLGQLADLIEPGDRQ